MGAPDAVVELVERFRHNFTTYLNPAYNETQVRIEFIDPFFKALSWDVDNSAGNAPQYRDVVHEDAIKVGIDSRAPDYSFRVGGARKFFVEAKKPAVNLKDDPSPAYQLRRYAWSAKLPLSIVTDFQEFVVYDCRVRPANTDKSPVARIMYATFDEYEHRWDEIASIFSKDAIYKGSFDQYAESTKAKKGTAEVDTAFLKEIESWRDELARNIALRNRSLSTRELNYAVQATIDRIIFLRICEDRLIEPYGRLQGLVNGQNVWERLRTLFFEADHRYNSGLFHFEQERGRADAPDTLTPDLVIDDRVLKEILKRLYYPESPYEFSVLPADILGQVYEQFLGKVIRLTTGHQAKVEDKPEVKKAGGVYYTPTYIVDYIVKNTVGRLLEGLAPKQAADLRILDPACGSGSFLIGAYQCLLDWHRDWYVEHALDKKNKPIVQGRAGEWQLTTAEKKRILLNNIYGVDIDSQAVETTKLSLLLKVLEGETSETIDAQLSFLHERALPDLAANIKCGNSLIGPDFYDDQQLGLTGLDDEERYRINVFDWEAEFPQIQGKAVPEEQRGFDAVIGNPPYIRIQNLKEFAPREVEFYKKRYVAASKGNYDIYVVFVERGLSLLNEAGRLGYILPHKFFNAQYGEPLRGLLAKGGHLDRVVHFGHSQVFTNASTYTCLLLLSKARSPRFAFVPVDDIPAWRNGEKPIVDELPADSYGSSDWAFVVGRCASLFERLDTMPVRLRDVVTGMFVGQQTSADPVFVFKEHNLSQESGLTDVFSKSIGRWVTLESAALKDVVRSGSIGQYWAHATAKVLFPYDLVGTDAHLLTGQALQDRYPLARAYLELNRCELEAREHGGFRDASWYRFGRTQNLGCWEQPKLLVPYMVTDLAAYCDLTDNFYFINVTTGGYGLTVDPSFGSMAYLCALLNNRALDFYLKRISTSFRGGYYAANKQYIERRPVRVLSPNNAHERRIHDDITESVTALQEAKKQVQLCRVSEDQRRWEREATMLRARVDVAVYAAYGLTDDDIAIVESSIEKA